MQDKYDWKPLCGLSLIHPIAYHGSVVLNDVSFDLYSSNEAIAKQSDTKRCFIIECWIIESARYSALCKGYAVFDLAYKLIEKKSGWVACTYPLKDLGNDRTRLKG